MIETCPLHIRWLTMHASSSRILFGFGDNHSLALLIIFLCTKIALLKHWSIFKSKYAGRQLQFFIQNLEAISIIGFIMTGVLAILVFMGCNQTQCACDCPACECPECSCCVCDAKFDCPACDMQCDCNDFLPDCDNCRFDCCRGVIERITFCIKICTCQFEINVN